MEITLSPAAIFTLFTVVGPVLAIALFTIGQLSGPSRRGF